MPGVIVTGDPGQLVRVTMTRGLDPATNETGGVDDPVEARLQRYAFKVGNAFDEQSFDGIGANGTFDASNPFTCGAAQNTGKGGFAGDTTAPIGFVAAAIGAVGGVTVPVGPVTSPIYLTVRRDIGRGRPVFGRPRTTGRRDGAELDFGANNTVGLRFTGLDLSDTADIADAYFVLDALRIRSTRPPETRSWSSS